MITFSDHARAAMAEHGITDEEAHATLEYGTRTMWEVVDGERRYGNELLTKERIIVVIYTYRNDTLRVITCYEKRRKRS